MVPATAAALAAPSATLPAPACLPPHLLSSWHPFLLAGINSMLWAHILWSWHPCFCFLASILSCWLPLLLPSIIYSVLLACIPAVFFVCLPSILLCSSSLASWHLCWLPNSRYKLRLLRPPRPCLRLLACCLISSSWHPFWLVSLNSARLAYILSSWRPFLFPSLHFVLLASMPAS